MKNNEPKNLLDELRKIFYKNQLDIAMFAFPGKNNLKISNIDDLVNLKWNIMKLICENDMSDDKNKYMEFLEDTNNQENVNKFAFADEPSFLGAFLSSVELNFGSNALSIKWSKEKGLNKFAKLEIGNSDVQLESNNDLVKMFKAIYYLSAFKDKNNKDGNKSVIFNVEYIFANQYFMKQLIGTFFYKEQAQDFIVALLH